MSGTTTTEGYPYPLTSDFADVQDAFRLATAIDADLRAEQAPFRAFEGRLSFVGRQTVTGSGFISGTQLFKFGAIDWDNTGGAVVNATSWRQPTGQQPSWWMFGATLLTAIVSGTPVVGDMNMARIEVDTVDQVSGLTTSTFAYQRNDETNTAGEWINVFTMAPIYRGTVSLALILNGSTQKAVLAGSTFWGLYMGPVT
jgi:hypothetical protein